MVKVVISHPGEIILDEFTALVAQPTTPAQALPPKIGLVEISTSQPTDSAGDILVKLLTVDGAGSLLDADLLDGQHGAWYQDRANHTGAQAISTVTGLQPALDAKLDSSAYTAADVLAKLLTVDGTGSTLDADLLDGLNGAYYLDWANFTSKPATFPPTLPIPSSGVTGLDTKQASQDADIATRLTDAASDGITYGRKNGAWSATAAGLAEAPNDGALYGRQSLAWAKGVKLAGDTMTGQLNTTAMQVLAPAATSAIINLVKPASGLYCILQSLTGANLRWQIIPGDSIAESGGNAGSNFVINRYDDGGNYIDQPLSLLRSTGLATVKGDPTAALGIATKHYADVRTTRLNRMVNGALQHSQVNGDTLGTITQYMAADIFRHAFTGPVCSVQRVQTGYTPKGNVNRLRQIVTTAKGSLAATDFFSHNASIEGYLLNGLMWGYATAKPAVLRFGVRAPAGTYVVALRNNAGDRSFVKTYVISAGQANTDVEVVIPIPGETSGVWYADANLGLTLNFQWAVGSSFFAPVDGAWNVGNYIGHSSMSNGAAVLNNTFEIFDIGFYADPDNLGAAPPYENPDAADELLRCQRYYQTSITLFGGYGSAGANLYSPFLLRPVMRIMPTVQFTSVTYVNSSGLGYGASGPTAFYAYINATANGTAYANFAWWADARF